jgi:gluconate 2-dehydrogenase gamma chain
MDAQGGESRQGVNRREALRRLAVGGAAAATLPTWVDTLSAFALDHAHTHGQRAATAKTAAAWKPKVLTPHQNSTIITLSELIIPQTDTPGAKAANVNRFIDGVLADAPQVERAEFLAGLTALDERAKGEAGKPFVNATAEQQTAILTQLSALQEKAYAASLEAEKAGRKSRGMGERGPSQAEPAGAASTGSASTGSGTTGRKSADQIGAEFFEAIKSMTIIGYYTSEVGMRQEMGDDGTLFFAEFKGCAHPEHQGA